MFLASLPHHQVDCPSPPGNCPVCPPPPISLDPPCGAAAGAGGCWDSMLRSKLDTAGAGICPEDLLKPSYRSADVIPLGTNNCCTVCCKIVFDDGCDHHAGAEERKTDDNKKAKEE